MRRTKSRLVALAVSAGSMVVSTALVAPPTSVAAAETKQERILFQEGFDDADLAQRGWYDGSQFRIVGGARAGKGCVEYEWTDRQSKVQGSSGARHLFEPTEEVAIRLYLKLSKGWGWSGRRTAIDL